MKLHTKIFLLIAFISLVSYPYLSNINDKSTMPMRTESAKSSNLLPWPMDKAEQRQKILTFGKYVTPDPNTNPISPPERFTGYHTGLDIEILPEEKDATVTVKTICEGKILYSAPFVEGYGGVIIQECHINNEATSILYGHLKPTSIKASKGDEVIKQGSLIAELGNAYSEETGNTRKHLHLGIHKGNHIEFLGYVNDEKDLQEFIDPLPLLQK